jgi:adenine deaminase
VWTLVLGGMTPMEAIRVATLNGAKYLGMDQDIGSLETGKLADLSIINGDMLKDIRQSDRITHVMVNGRLYEAATMNEVGATPKARKPFFFQNSSDAPVPVDALGYSHGDGDGH